ncbi:MAG: hypothetical protein JW822_02095 [Spirochaetales bacterium]|nr:hypothetical protein [Spirochaetales bacterium]
MKSLSLLFLAMTLLLIFSCGVKHPASFEELAQVYRTAHETKNIGLIDSLIYWSNMPEPDKKRILGTIAGTFENVIVSAKTDELPEDFRMISGDYMYPFAPEKTLKISYKNPGDKGGVLIGMNFTIGMKEGKAYILYRSEEVK